MPDALVGRMTLSHRIGTFSYGVLLRPMLHARTKWMELPGFFCRPREHPNIFQGTKQHRLIFQENKGINIILGDRNVAIWKTPRSVSMHWLYAFVIVHQQSQCFDALLMFKRMLMSEKLIQTGRMMQFMHRICSKFCVRRSQQFCTLMLNGTCHVFLLENLTPTDPAITISKSG